MICFQRNSGGRKQEISPGIVEKRHSAVVGRHIVVKSVGIMGVLLMVRRVKSIFNKGSCPYALGFYFFAGGGALHADCKALVSRPDEN